MLKRKFLSSLVLIALVSGCDIDDDNEDTPRSLVGLWSSNCIADDSNPDYELSFMNSFEFTETEVIIKSSYYADLVCENVVLLYTYSGTYEIGEDVSTPTGVDATEIDIILTERSDTLEPEPIDYDFTLLDLFVIEGTYLYLGDESGKEGVRATDIDYGYNLELQE